MAKKKRVNSCEKGKVGERKAAEYLRSLGFADARRTQQHNGAEGLSDVICPESLPGVHIEVKYGVVGMDLGTGLFREACDQARRDAGYGSWAVLWKPKRCRQWRLTILDEWTRGLATFAEDDVIADLLRCFVAEPAEL